ncbi:hypothetical protein LTR66_006183 [Elasticomyces elasticus]|nr:hypothetical protein LTR66_006183 [Elasticomyces elasticus]
MGPGSGQYNMPIPGSADGYDSNNRTSSNSNPMFSDAPPSMSAPMTTDARFDILDWHPAYVSCQRYFLDHAQHEPGTQALCALTNIMLPCQWPVSPIHNSSGQPAHAQGNPSSSSYSFSPWPRPNLNSPNSRNNNNSNNTCTWVSLVPYIRRLIVTGFDKPGILHGFFGDDYRAGIGPLQDCERRNYLFAAKAGGWRSCKKSYDMNERESVPFLKPLQHTVVQEIEAAEKNWSEWLLMEDWMVGPRAPEGAEEGIASDMPDNVGGNER